MDEVSGLYCERFPTNWEELRFSNNPVKRLTFATTFKSNPRSREYMENLFSQRFPQGELVEKLQFRSIPRNATVVLTYQDSIGLGWTLTELRLRIRMRTKLIVLNGRGRLFELTFRNQLRLVLKRFLEKSMIPEVLFTVLLLPILPFVAAVDWMRGKR